MVVGVILWSWVFVFESDQLDWQQKPSDIKNDGGS